MKAGGKGKKEGQGGGDGGDGEGVGEPGYGAERGSAERVPLGRCMSPIPPAPNPCRGEMMLNDTTKQPQSKQSSSRAGRRQSHILVVSDATRGGHPTKPMPKWKRGYVGFKRKVD